jgi:hypothetical protein
LQNELKGKRLSALLDADYEKQVKARKVELEKNSLKLMSISWAASAYLVAGLFSIPLDLSVGGISLKASGPPREIVLCLIGILGLINILISTQTAEMDTVLDAISDQRAGNDYTYPIKLTYSSQISLALPSLRTVHNLAPAAATRALDILFVAVMLLSLLALTAGVVAAHWR